LIQSTLRSVWIVSNSDQILWKKSGEFEFSPFITRFTGIT
jgi:hypothetical protein